MIKIKFPDEVRFASPFQLLYNKGISEFNAITNKYESQLDLLESDLTRKSGEIFNSIKATAIENVSFSMAFDKIESAIKQHNKWLAAYEEIREAAIKKILNHFVAEFIDSERYNAKEQYSISAHEKIIKIDECYLANKSEMNSIMSQLNDIVMGQNELNIILKILLNRDDIQIAIQNDKFILNRGGHPAYSLSEGEKSAIAFSYFLTELKAIRVKSELNQWIIFIDDPVSSLDSNHIFQVRSLLLDFFMIDDYEQLFISTHNFEFFSMLKDSILFNKSSKVSYYLLKRNDDCNSELCSLPDTLLKYNSEYVSLFHLLKEYKEFSNKTDFPYAIMLPNVLRRFLELYTAMKFPSSKSLDNRIKEIFSTQDGTYHKTKLLHWFSHENQFEKVLQHDDKLIQIDDAIKELLDHIESNDPLHWKGLINK
jgi:wobble nucleotide-excising tRNase